MRKSDKKIDNDIRIILTSLCESLLESFEGFEWLTHKADYKNFPNSLRILVVFDTDTRLQSIISSKIETQIVSSICRHLENINIKLNAKTNRANKKSDQQIVFDSEESCRRESGGNWSKRLNNLR